MIYLLLQYLEGYMNNDIGVIEVNVGLFYFYLIFSYTIVLLITFTFTWAKDNALLEVNFRIKNSVTLFLLYMILLFAFCVEWHDSIQWVIAQCMRSLYRLLVV